MQGVRVVQAAGHDAQVIQRSCCGAQAWRSICSGVGVCMMVVMMMMMIMMTIIMMTMMMITTSIMMMLTMVNRARRKSAKKRRAHGQRARARMHA